MTSANAIVPRQQEEGKMDVDIRALRREKGWSQAELARRAGMHPSTVCLIESGKMKAYPVQQAKLLKALEDVGDDARA